MFFYKLRVQLSDRLFYQLPARLKRVTPLTWLVWAMLLSDLAAPGYLVFHLGTREVDASALAKPLLQSIAEAATELWEVAVSETDD